MDAEFTGGGGVVLPESLLVDAGAERIRAALGSVDGLVIPAAGVCEQPGKPAERKTMSAEFVEPSRAPNRPRTAYANTPQKSGLT